MISREIPDEKDKKFIEEYQRKIVPRFACYGTMPDSINNVEDILSRATAGRVVILDCGAVVMGKSAV